MMCYIVFITIATFVAELVSQFIVQQFLNKLDQKINKKIAVEINFLKCKERKLEPW